MSVVGWTTERLKVKWGGGKRKLGVKSLKIWIEEQFILKQAKW